MSRPGIVCLSLVLVLGLPLLGVLWAGEPLGRYLEFPPRTSYVQHEPFSWPAFIALALLIAIFLGSVLFRIAVSNHQLLVINHRPSAFVGTLHASRFRLPWWGWLALGWTCLWWVIAWSRVPRLVVVQEHTFTPLWLGYIMIVNACTFARTGRCMMLHRPRYFLSLFPLSAAFWWVFEYLNRFVQNWYYVGVADLSSFEYFFRATTPFSTVLPALAALICGIFWELWNWKSLAHWEYALPFVHRFQLFEMPLLGYAGYLPFGLECVVVADLCLRRQFSGGAEYDSHE